LQLFYWGIEMNDIVEMPQDKPRALVAATPATPADMVIYAMQNGGTIEQVREMMQLQREWEADQARKAYVSDMADFKKNPPEIIKDKQVAFSGTQYMHATLGAVTEAIVVGLARHGFSHRWDTAQNGGVIEVTCILTHKLGHSERTTLTGAKDESGKKNQIQQVASTITYLQRYTLLAATGVATKDQADDDGRGAELDTRLADHWIATANAAPNLKDLERVWSLGVAAIQSAGDQHAYKEFKAAVSACKAKFPAPEPEPNPAKELADEEKDLQRTGGAA